ncbi:LOW QUALITY PROTEIN: ATP-dependent DNA helicase PIF1-like [Gigantopelta aegis]|uniref:LOW QUALITY PROTEIN: ATP-dependent DNA helicase PIF1-like n=1 Tax=Gigantopelta aegis TaxID=1735272 RepID=UPI001B88D655|nr:LOW QUALITY PROTEIN: ATP-dependent DNA helicase PIF1-like [Gigantopelta aegis]
MEADQRLAYKIIENGHNVVVLGQTGTGKSVLVKETQRRLIAKVCVGDFYQLPPAPNDMYSDPERHCFESQVWMNVIKHKIQLNTVLRQDEFHLINAINELEKGIPSPATNAFMKNLSRPLHDLPPSINPTVLYGTNFEVDWHNASELAKLPGDIVMYKSKLKNIPAKSNLCLTKTFVNGMQGIVKQLDADGPTIQFDSGILKVEKTTFSLFSPKENVIKAERYQYPIAFAFALTIHKAQGLTLQHLIVNCNNIFQPGQLGVAVGRAVNTAGLQNLHNTDDRVPFPDQQNSKVTNALVPKQVITEEQRRMKRHFRCTKQVESGYPPVITTSDADTVSETKYPDSLSEICRKQNMTFGLTNISDLAFEFFLAVERKRIPMYSMCQVQKYKGNLLQHIHDNLNSDKQLLEQHIPMIIPTSMILCLK